MQYKIPFHPFLFALFPVLSFWASNGNSVSAQDTLRTLIVCVAGTGLLYLIMLLISRNPEKPALLASLFTVTFLYFGQAYYSFEGRFSYLDHAVFFIALWLLFFLTGLYVILRVCKHCSLLNSYLNSVCVILVVFPLWQVLQFSILPSLTVPVPANISGVSAESVATNQDHPNIYYFILDGYGRSDVLTEFYSLDNADFLDTLQQRGFYVADQSITNYTQTFLSISSSLTGNYLDAAELDPTSEDRNLIQNYFDENSYFQRFNRIGYKTVAMTEFNSILRYDSAGQIISTRSTLNNFELGFQSLTLSRFWSPSLYEYQHWETVRSQLDSLEHLPLDSTRPQFIFAHLLIPHPPFVFDASGDFVSTNSFLIGDGSHYRGSRQEYVRGYTWQVQHLNIRLIKIVDHLLSNSERPVVIILQGDHGPGLNWDFESLENSCLQERLPILNAYYFSDESARKELYSGISPVNTFRLIFDQILNQPTPLLDDRSYFSTWTNPYNFTEVTEKKETCSLLQ